jgi:hypothetical protein
MSKLYQTVYIEKGEQLIHTDKESNVKILKDNLKQPLHSGDQIVAITGSLRSLEDSFGIYTVIGYRKMKNYLAVVAKGTGKYSIDLEYDIKECIIHKKYNE